MFTKLFLLAFLAIGVNCRYILLSPVAVTDRILTVFDDQVLEQGSEVFQNLKSRVRRQVHGVMNSNPDGSLNVMGKLPLAGNDRNVLSAIGGVNGAKPGGGVGAAFAGASLDNVNGHSLSVTGKHIPDFGNQLTGAGKLNLLHNAHHDLSANAFATKTMPSNPMIPNFNTYGGGLDYKFNDKIGASLGMAHTDLFKKTDYSAMGNLNLFKNPTTSLDFSAGATKSISPFIPNSSWQPSAGLSFSKYF